MQFLRNSNSMLPIVRMFKITLHVKAVASRDIFLLGAVDYGVLLGRHVAHAKLRHAGLGCNLHARLFFKAAGFERDAIRNGVDWMRLLIFSQFLGALLAAGAFACCLRGLLFRPTWS